MARALRPLWRECLALAAQVRVDSQARAGCPRSLLPPGEGLLAAGDPWSLYILV